MKRILAAVLILVLIPCAMLVVAHRRLSHPVIAAPAVVAIDSASDAYVRDAVVLLHSPHGSCSGIQIEVAKENYKVLTAAHCRGLLDEANTVMARGEDGREIVLTFIAEDDRSDLMLLTGSKIFGHISVASKKLKIHDPVHTLTHGRGAPTYRTDGESLDEVIGGFLIDEISTAEGMETCTSHAKYTVIMGEVFGQFYCVLNVMSLRATAQAIPGSSGGPLLNASGELVGIVSYGSPQEPTFTYYVRLVDIQEFVKATAN